MTRPLRLAIFSDCAPQLLESALVHETERRGLPVTVKSWAYTLPPAVMEELKAFAPDRVVIWATPEAGIFPDTRLFASLPYPCIVTTMPACDDGVCGHLALMRPESLRARIVAWNAALVALASTAPNVTLLDAAMIQETLGRNATFDPRLWEVASVALTPKATERLATRLTDLLCAQAGRLRKALVTDLDGTLWDGIVSEVGRDNIRPDTPGFPAYRAWLKALAARGVFLAVASKNNADTALSAFGRDELGLKADDFSAFVTGWGSKTAMLRTIAARLHIATDSLVFIDDRPEERAAVRALMPEVCVPELPEDPARRVPYLASLNLFETDRITEDDLLRRTSLMAERSRAEAAHLLTPETYVAALEQTLTPEPLGPSNLERAAQLTQRCNQFNMRGTRYTAAELNGKTGWVYRLRDRFGDLGVISAVILNGWTIDTWVLSCRALNRGVEALILNHLKSLGPIRGAYRATERNGRCKTVYEENGVPEP